MDMFVDNEKRRGSERKERGTEEERENVPPNQPLNVSLTCKTLARA